MNNEVKLYEESLDLSGSDLIEAAPTPGVVGLISVSHLVDALKAKKIGELFSPHLPHVSLVGNNGVASRPTIELYFHQDKNVKLLFLVRNFPLGGNEGGIAIAQATYEFCHKHGIRSYCFLGGVTITGKRQVYIASHDSEVTDKLSELGAAPIESLDSLPLDEMSGSLLRLFARDKKSNSVLLSESSSYLPDPVAAKSLLSVLVKFIGLDIDLSRMDKEIRKYKQLREQLEKTLRSGVVPFKSEQPPRKEPSYIG